ncbi:MAG: hypothetical protein ACTSRA_22860 [Promethearchaeota archaeon]
MHPRKYDGKSSGSIAGKIPKRALITPGWQVSKYAWMFAWKRPRRSVQHGIRS